MKPTTIFMSGFTLAILCQGIAYGQFDREIPLSVTPFSKNVTALDLSNNFDMSFLNREFANNSSGNRNNTGLSLRGTQFIVDNVGVGLEIDIDRRLERTEDIEIITSSTIASFHGVYGNTLGALNYYAKAAVSVGVDNYKYDSPVFEQDSKKNLFGLDFEVGMPVGFKQGSGFYVTPFVSYNYNVISDDDYKDILSGFNLGTRLNIYLPGSSYAKNFGEVSDFSEDMYSQGTNVIGGNARFNVNFGSESNWYIGGDEDDEEIGENSYYGGMLKTGYYHYFFDDIAIGGDLMIRTSGNNNKDTDVKQSGFSWKVTPKIQANLPVSGELNNTFFFIGYGFGNSLDKTKYLAQTTEVKENNTSFDIGAGHNVFFAKGFALVPILNYTRAKSKNTETDVQSERNGIEFIVSMRHAF